MISIVSLWLPILLSAALVFVASSIIHMVLGYHNNDFRKVPDEDGTMDALRPLNIPPGDYVLPFAGGMEVIRSDEYRAKVENGPVAFVTVLDPGEIFDMGPQLMQWFAYSLLIGIVAAFVAIWTLPAGAEYLTVFRLTGTVTFVCYAMAQPQRSIWFKQKWSTTLLNMFDGFVYASVSAGAFAWLWP
jgi:hypothetical protein